jgi:putative flippase GtrA
MDNCRAAQLIAAGGGGIKGKTMTPELLASIAGIVLSLVFSYLPGAKDWFEQLDGNYKRLVMLASLVVVALAIFGLSCANWYALVACSAVGVKTLVEMVIIAAVTNQAAYALTPRKG